LLPVKSSELIPALGAKLYVRRLSSVGGRRPERYRSVVELDPNLRIISYAIMNM